ncbi:MAG: hypothetical protein ACK5Y2_13485 [Bdellovibrionales bacterium]
MKSYLFMTLVVLSVVSPSWGRILPYSEFEKLSEDSQYEYLEGVQTIIAEMAVKSQGIAATEKKAERGLASEAPDECEAYFRRPRPQAKDPGLRDRLQRPLDAAVKAMFPGKSEEEKIQADILRCREHKRAQQAQRDYFESQRQKISEPPVIPASKAEFVPPAPRPFYHCMYAGWVIKKDPCTSPSTWPQDFHIEGVDRSRMRCEGTALCNPLLFGVRLPEDCESFADCPERASALCVDKSQDASLRCAREARCDPNAPDAALKCTRNGRSKALRSAIQMIRLNDGAYETFRKDFENLCDHVQIQNNPFFSERLGAPRPNAEALREDVRKTCDVARGRLLKLEALIAYREQMALEKQKARERKAREETRNEPQIRAHRKPRGATRQ